MSEKEATEVRAKATALANWMADNPDHTQEEQFAFEAGWQAREPQRGEVERCVCGHPFDKHYSTYASVGCGSLHCECEQWQPSPQPQPPASCPRCHHADEQPDRSMQKRKKPIDKILFCPKCGTQHVDAPDPRICWFNPPHHEHLCSGCGELWAPFSFDTYGVASLPPDTSVVERKLCDCELRNRQWNGFGKCLSCGRKYEQK